jgi:acyl-CoA reductase-like NAD-dependent aldehyde dehydrogenase
MPGSFYPATVLTDVSHDMLVMTAETFGPIAPLMVVDSMAEAFELAADSEYGLSASVLSPHSETLEAAQALDVGTLWINTWHAYADGALHQPGGSSGTGAIGWRGRQFLDTVSAPQFVSTPS